MGFPGANVFVSRNLGKPRMEIPRDVHSALTNDKMYTDIVAPITLQKSQVNLEAERRDRVNGIDTRREAVIEFPQRASSSTKKL